MQYFCRLVVGVCSVLVCLHVVCGPAEARRVALVIGNADYKVGPLQNPINDATAVAEALEKQLRFDKVILRKNLGFDGFRAALMEIARESAGAEISLVYFAGHGTEVGGRNFLIPVDATLARASALSVEAIPLETVLGQLSGAWRLKLVILDACRNNLFPLSDAKRSVTRGLYRIEPEDNTLVAYAAKDGTTADDGPGRRHSPFTEALLKHIATPGVEIRFLFAHVRDDVMAITNREQQPHVYGTLGSQKLFLQPPSGPSAAPKPDVPVAEIAKAKAEVEAAKARAEAEFAQAEAARLKSRSELERAKAEAERAAAELAKARAEADLARVRAQTEVARALAEAELARAQAERQRQAFLPPRIHDTTTLFNPAAVPSFNCREYAATPLSSANRNPQTDVYCIEPEAARVDFQLGQVFRESISGLSAPAKRDAVTRQKQWILERNRRCPAAWDDLGVPARRSQIAQCLIGETHARMHELRRR